MSPVAYTLSFADLNVGSVVSLLSLLLLFLSLFLVFVESSLPLGVDLPAIEIEPPETFFKFPEESDIFPTGVTVTLTPLSELAFTVIENDPSSHSLELLDDVPPLTLILTLPVYDEEIVIFALSPFEIFFFELLTFISAAIDFTVIAINSTIIDIITFFITRILFIFIPFHINYFIISFFIRT
ncbi:unknown [Clostridium sp. CAG:492]|nr:unknown [Clostridium sp. CAG:492]